MTTDTRFINAAYRLLCNSPDAKPENSPAALFCEARGLISDDHRAQLVEEIDRKLATIPVPTNEAPQENRQPLIDLRNHVLSAELSPKPMKTIFEVEFVRNYYDDLARSGRADFEGISEKELFHALIDDIGDHIWAPTVQFVEVTLGGSDDYEILTRIAVYSPTQDDIESIADDLHYNLQSTNMFDSFEIRSVLMAGREIPMDEIRSKSPQLT